MENNPFKDPRIKKYEKISLAKKLKKNLRKLDIYAMPIALRYKGEKKFYTNFGAIVSAILILLMLLYTTISINSILEPGEAGDVPLVTADDFSASRLDKNLGTSA